MSCAISGFGRAICGQEASARIEKSAVIDRMPDDQPEKVEIWEDRCGIKSADSSNRGYLLFFPFVHLP
jgi:hypothetical protein